MTTVTIQKSQQPHTDYSNETVQNANGQMRHAVHPSSATWPVTWQHRTAKDNTGTADAGLPQMARDNVGGHAVSYLHRVSKKMKVTVTRVISQSSRMVLREKGQQKVQSGRA